MKEKISYPERCVARFLANTGFTGDVIRKAILEEKKSSKKKGLESLRLDSWKVLALSRAGAIEKASRLAQEEEKGIVKLFWKRFVKFMSKRAAPIE